jgi:hypothetical protein
MAEIIGKRTYLTVYKFKFAQYTYVLFSVWLKQDITQAGEDKSLILRQSSLEKEEFVR